MAKPNLTMLLGLGSKSKQSAPPSFGEDAEPDAGDPMEAMEAEEPQEDQGGEEGIAPEAVCYRDAQQHCEACVYMAQDGTCDKLKIPVEPTASCNLFKATEQGAADMEMPAEEGEGSPAEYA